MKVKDESRKELDDVTYQRIKSYCEDGDKLAESGSYDAAIMKYNEAFQLVPQPREEWNASTWILIAIGDAAFLAGYNEFAREVFQDVMYCPGAIGNPFVHLRLGQVLFDAGELDKAADELMRAYIGGEYDVFSEEDPKYFEFLKTRAVI